MIKCAVASNKVSACITDGREMTYHFSLVLQGICISLVKFARAVRIQTFLYIFFINHVPTGTGLFSLDILLSGSYTSLIM